MGMRLLLLVLLFSIGTKGDDSQDDWFDPEFDNPTCEPIPWRCICHDTTITISVPTYSEELEEYEEYGMFYEEDDCTPVIDFDTACKAACSTLNVNIPEHLVPEGTVQKRSLLDHFYPRKIKHEPKRGGVPSGVPSGVPLTKGITDAPRRSPRSPRYLLSDLYPTEPCNSYQLNNAYVSCDTWPNYRTCTIQCIFGHAMEDMFGAVTNWTISCRDSEDKWFPRNYTDCAPYVSCGGARLIRPGFVTCRDRLDGPSYCDIECFDYDVFDATDKQSYECLDIDTFGPELPQCAVKREYTGKLVKKPDM